MQIKKTLIGTIAVLAPLVTLLPQLTSIATAQVRSSCNASIIGSQRGSRVNMRSGPGTVFASPSYVLVGQTVNILSDPTEGILISRTDDGGMKWYFVEYVPSNTRGWVRDDFLSSCL